jgi:hypothetical protein
LSMMFCAAAEIGSCSTGLLVDGGDDIVVGSVY